MTQRTTALQPPSRLPALTKLHEQSQSHILSLLSGLVDIYCPLSASVSSAFAHDVPTRQYEASDLLAAPLVDSGYVSETNEDDELSSYKLLSVLRTDEFERSCAQRWVTGFVTRAEGCPAFTSEEARQSAIDDAYTLIETLSLPAGPVDEDEDTGDEGFRRDFVFETTTGTPVQVHLYDKLAGTNSADPDDVGLQSWGASILFSQLLCRDPVRFGLTSQWLSTSLRIVELGAGTGLVSLALGSLLSKLGTSSIPIIATDYHAAVLVNLRNNVAGNLLEHPSAPITACSLDWSAPAWEEPLNKPADMIIATDVIYSPLHATWVRDCVSELLAPDGVFWLVAAVRQNGRFEGVRETVRAAFMATDGERGEEKQKLRILDSQRIEKQVGIGRGDESWYELFKIGWQ